MPKTLETVLTCQLDRHFSPKLVGQFAQALEASGVVDYAQSWDQLTSWYPRSLWQPDVTPLANVIKDCDSFGDGFLNAAFAVASTDKLGITVSTDAMRRGPAEMMQAGLTLAGATEGRASISIGAGELKQCKPFGYKRSEGLRRLEDMFQLLRKLESADEPFDFDGNFWHYRNAWIGGARPHLPKILAMGGGPKLVDLSVQYADGLVTAVPVAFQPESWGAAIGDIKHKLDQNGRDPEAFTFGAWSATLLHEDENVIDRALDNPLCRFFAATIGRLNQADWDAEGIEPIMPRGWHYANDLLPAQMSRQEVDDIVSKVTRKMVEKTFTIGTPKQVAAQYQQYVDVGTNWVSVVDFLPQVLPIEEGAASLDRTLEVCRILKEQAGAIG